MWLNTLYCQSAKVMCAGFMAALLVVFGIQAHAGLFVSNINTDLAAYNPGSPVTIYVDLTNSSAVTLNGSVTVIASHLGYVCSNLPIQTISGLAAHATTTKVFNWMPSANDFQGYLLKVSVLDGNSNILDAGSSAVDISSDWRRFPRYGYMAQYWYQLDAGNFTWQLKNYHINGLQFYDWAWKHHVPYNGGSTWKDIANRDIYRNTLTNLITAAHTYNMVAMAYDDWGAAYDDCLTDGSGVTLSMGRFSAAPASSGNQLAWVMPSGWATPQLRLMNNRDPGWQSYIYGRMQQAITNFGFDGWHMDNLVWDHVVYDYNGNQFNLDNYNAAFINNAKVALGGKDVTFNNVDGSAVTQVAQSANVEFIYSELWDGHANYNDLKTFVDDVRRFGSKATVYAAYMNRGTASANFNEVSVRLADAAMFASGTDHLELGDGDRMLSSEYFPADGSVTMTSSLRSAMRSYYDFLVAYENLLRDDTVSANNAAAISGVTTSSAGAVGAVWVISKKSPGYNIIHLVNLLNNTSTTWRDTNGTYLTPPTQNNLPVKMYYTGAISGGKLWWASPDVNSCAASQLSYATGSDGGGDYINFIVPQLQYWDMIWLELNGTVSAANQIEAENFDSMAGISTETTTDTGGGLDVGSVKNTSGDSYLVFNNVDFGTGPASISARVASAVNNGTVEFRLDNPGGTLIATVPIGNTGGWQNWQTKSAAISGVSGVHRLFVVFKNAPSNLNWFNFSFNFNNTLPSPWATADIGSVGLTGGAAYNGGIYALVGSGSDIESTADGFRFAYQTSGTNCEIRARVVSVQNTNPWAKGGVMIRDNAATDAANAAVVVTPDNGVAFQRRNSTGGGTTSTVVSGVNAPTWVRLTRLGSTLTGYYSVDGTNWIQIGTSQTVNLSASALIGLAVTAHNNATTGVATFDHVSVNNAPMLAVISNRTMIAGATLFITNSASDTDVPAQTLTYNLLDTPDGSLINTNTGVFSWRPTIAQSPSTQTVAVTVSDNGIPSMSATQSFFVTVNQPARPVQDAQMTSKGAFSLTVSGDVGPDYTLLGSTNLINWQPLFLTNSPVMPFTWTDSLPNLFPARFYRVILGP